MLLGLMMQAGFHGGGELQSYPRPQSPSPRTGRTSEGKLSTLEQGGGALPAPPPPPPCGSEIYCACSSVIHKRTQKIWSDFNKAF